ncbi:hypothetical protein E2C01_038189 [Portunus trituberculatus]|uniref:Endonuclease/exonuclease/phosphatase domain-containing protein n=1 Tax=Portunus trituberculatus TaxID=210409 RepID=A0A5B7FGL2_PORTR|nr:hypothetical protein [Portunus trituberculatus]
MAGRRTKSRPYTLSNKELTIVYANVRGFHTNIGEFTHSAINRHRADIVFVCETFLDDSVPQTYVRVQGYSLLVRKDRSTQGGGIAFCYKDTVNVQVVEPPVPVPRELEILTLKVTDSDSKGVMVVGCYRPPRRAQQ